MCPPLVPILCQTNPVRDFPAYFFTKNCNILLPLKRICSKESYPSGLSTKTLCESRLHAICPAHLTLLNLIIIVITVENTSWSSSFCDLQSLDLCSLLGTIICVKLKLSKILDLRMHVLPLMWETKIYTHIEQWVTLWLHHCIPKGNTKDFGLNTNR
jgi:hypothetical protein